MLLAHSALKFELGTLGRLVSQLPGWSLASLQVISLVFPYREVHSLTRITKLSLVDNGRSLHICDIIKHSVSHAIWLLRSCVVIGKLCSPSRPSCLTGRWYNIIVKSERTNAYEVFIIKIGTCKYSIIVHSHHCYSLAWSANSKAELKLFVGLQHPWFLCLLSQREGYPSISN